MSQAIDDLRHEHDAILLALRILAAMNQRLDVEQVLEVADLHDFVGFLKEFADKCHHGKEEGWLFPALLDTGAPSAGGLVGTLLAEHVQGRQCLADMEAALQPDFRTPEFVAAGQAYADLLTAHIDKENSQLFPLAEQLLPEERKRAIFGAFQAHEDQVIGAGRHEQLHRLLRKWEAKYLAAV